MLPRRAVAMFDVFEMSRCRGLLMAHVADLSEFQANVQVGYTQVRRVEGKAKQRKLRSVVELVESAQATRQGQGRRLVWSWCLIRHTSPTHAGARQSRMALLLFHFPAPRLPQQLFHHSLHLHFIRSQSILQSSFHLPARIPATNLCIRAAITPPTQSTHSSRAVPIRPNEAIPAVTQPTTHSQSFTCRLPRPVLLLAATLLRIKASAILSAVE